MRLILMIIAAWSGAAAQAGYAQTATQAPEPEDIAETILEVVTRDSEFSPLPPGFLDAAQGFEAMQERLAVSRSMGAAAPALTYHHPAYRSIEGYTFALSVPKSVSVETFPQPGAISEISIDFGKTLNLSKRLSDRFTVLWGQPASIRGDTVIWRRPNLHPKGVTRPFDQGDFAKVILQQTSNGRLKLTMDRRDGKLPLSNASQTLAPTQNSSDQSSRPATTSADSRLDPIGDL